LNADKTINRSRLAEAAFGPSHRVEELNAIVHPAVIAHENKWMEDIGAGDPLAVAIVEAALILEAGAAGRFDYLVVVTCREEQRIERFAQRLGITREAARVEVARRMAAQMPDAEKIKAADFVIDNSGPLDATERQVREVFAALRGRAG
ncbi:MAG TPA: dephospho-CoA kinase, partial [Bryobacteraceae bacterium]|nr:dephospho-CoA kinase [Bryobacteraceae bacterium]